MSSGPARRSAARRRRLVGLALLLLAAVAAAVVLWQPWRYRVVLTREQLQARVEERFPIERRELLLTVRLSDPAVLLDARSDRIGLGVSLTAESPLARPIHGRAELDGAIRYDPETGELYLDAARIARLRVSGVAERDVETARGLINVALPEVLSRIPVYRLHEQRGGDVLARRTLRRVDVRGGQVVAEFGL